MSDKNGEELLERDSNEYEFLKDLEEKYDSFEFDSKQRITYDQRKVGHMPSDEFENIDKKNSLELSISGSTEMYNRTDIDIYYENGDSENVDVAVDSKDYNGHVITGFDASESDYFKRPEKRLVFSRLLYEEEGFGTDEEVIKGIIEGKGDKLGLNQIDYSGLDVDYDSLEFRTKYDDEDSVGQEKFVERFIDGTWKGKDIDIMPDIYIHKDALEAKGDGGNKEQLKSKIEIFNVTDTRTPDKLSRPVENNKCLFEVTPGKEMRILWSGVDENGLVGESEYGDKPFLKRGASEKVFKEALDENEEDSTKDLMPDIYIAHAGQMHNNGEWDLGKAGKAAERPRKDELNNYEEYEKFFEK